MSQKYTPEQVEKSASALPNDMGALAAMLRAYAATLRQQAGRVDEAVAKVVRRTDGGMSLAFIRHVEPLEDGTLFYLHPAAIAQNTQGDAVTDEIIMAFSDDYTVHPSNPEGDVPIYAATRAALECIAPMLHAERAQNTQGDAVAYFSADPAEGSFNKHETLAEAVAGAERLLESAQDDAADYGWQDEPPQICYGIVLGGCVEKDGSRQQAPEGSEYTELVDYRLTQPVHAERARVPNAALRLIEDAAASYKVPSHLTPLKAEYVKAAARNFIAHLNAHIAAAPSQPKDAVEVER